MRPVSPLRLRIAHAGAAVITHSPFAYSLALALGSDTNYLLIGLSIGVLILSLSVHEAAHAWVAYRCGDPTAYNEGRMTLDPLVHIDPVWSILLPIVFYFTLGFPFGGAKPVPVNPYQLRNPPRDMMLVAIAGPLSNVLLALLCLVAWKLVVFGGGMDPNQLPAGVLQLSVILNIALAVFNMIPIPPLDGSRVMGFLLRGKALEAYEQIERYGFIIIIALIYFGGTGKLMGPAVTSTWSFLYKVTGGNWTL